MALGTTTLGSVAPASRIGSAIAVPPSGPTVPWATASRDRITAQLGQGDRAQSLAGADRQPVLARQK